MRGFSSTQDTAQFGLDDASPKSRKTTTDAVWRWRELNAPISVATPGLHAIKLYRLEPGVEVDKIVIMATRVVPKSLGPPESPRN
jgi:hypothetical protein